ncbi:MAG: sialidase, partial [Gemmatimonadota bacterium]|nr:sialidase [Gemmatimonadota bacterium]
NKVYIGSQHVHVTTDGGQSWREISPDLTRNDKSKQQNSGGLTPDNIGVEYANTIFSIAESRLTPGLIWVGTNDGFVQLTRDGGRTWANVTANMPGKPELGTVQHIEPSRYDAATAYVAIDAHQENDRDPWVYKTSDYGRTWKLIVNGIPRSPLSYAHVIRQDPVRRGLLYLGTENALYVSFDDGERWQPLQLNLPPAPVYDMVIQEHFNDLVVGTYGRGFWILDDLSPLQRLTPEVVASSAHLFAPRPAYRFRSITGNYSVTDDPAAGTNPPYGAAISYWLRAAPQDSVTVTILDAGGTLVRTLRGTRQAGLNRVYWDLENEPSRAPRMRTKPMHFPEFAMDSGGTRDAAGFGTISVLMPPGRYTVKLTVGGRDYAQPLEVRKDPHSAGTEQDMGAQTKLLLRIQSDHKAAAGILNAIEEARAALQRLTADSARDRTPAELRSGAAALEQKLIAVEERLQDLRITGRGQDAVRWPVRLGGQLSYLAGGIASSDFAPTTQQRAVHELLERELRATRTALEELVRRDVATFNALLSGRGLRTIDVRLP